MTNTKNLREQAEKLSERRVNMAAQAEGFEHTAERMVAEGTHGHRDVEWHFTAAEAADRAAIGLAEAEAHAWDAYDDAVQAEHDAAYFASLGDDLYEQDR